MKKLILLALIIMAGMQTADAQRPQNRKQQTTEQVLLQAKLNLASDRFDKIQGVINLYHTLSSRY